VSKPLSSVLNTKKTGGNPFILGASKLGDGSYYTDNEDYYISNICADENGVLEKTFTITLSGNNIVGLTFVFDDYNNQYPTSITVNGTTHTNSSPTFTVTIDPAEYVTVEINNWSAPNYPLRIQGIYVALTLDLDDTNLKSIERKLFDRSDTTLPSWGIISNVGNIVFNDMDGAVGEYIEQSLITSGLKCEIYINNSTSGAQQLVGIYTTDTWSYENNNREVNITLVDDLTEWQDITIDGIDYDPTSSTEQTAKDIYEYLFSKTPSKYNMEQYSALPTATQNVLATTYIVYPLLESSSLWTAWNKLCALCLLHIYKDNYGYTLCRYNDNN
jgi:hypothetical protein